MEEQAKERIRIRCQESLHQNETLRNLLPGVGPDTLRADFARCAIDLALEHHSAIVGLVLHGHYGSAAALLRPLLEAGTCAYWLMYVASCERLHKLTDPAKDIPVLGAMLHELKGQFPQSQVLWEAQKTGQPGSWLHQFTHGGVIQLLRRGRSDGWTEKEAHTHLLFADIFSALATAVGTVISSAPELAAYVFPRRDVLGNESVIFLGAPPTASQPHHLPEPLSDGCGSPSGC